MHGVVQISKVRGHTVLLAQNTNFQDKQNKLLNCIFLVITFILADLRNVSQKSLTRPIFIIGNFGLNIIFIAKHNWSTGNAYTNTSCTHMVTQT